MKLTTKSEYSILALIYLARSKDGKYVKTQDICDRYGLSKKYLEQLFIVLKQNKFIKSKTSSTGGYKLARPAGKIRIADVIRLMDGALAPTEAVSKYFYSSTPLEKEVKIITVFKEIRDYIADKMERLRLSDLI